MTQDEFNKLPMLLYRHQVSEILGVDGRTIATLVEQKQLTKVCMSRENAERRKYRYRKIEVARICGLKP